MKTTTKEVYYCEHCNKHLFRAAAMIKHEAQCKRNPTNYRPCFRCKNLTKKEAERYSPKIKILTTGNTFVDAILPQIETKKSKHLLFCSEINSFIYTPINAAKGNFKHTKPDGKPLENNPMPHFCEKFSEKTAL